MSSSIQLILLNEAPDFSKKATNLLEKESTVKQTATNQLASSSIEYPKIGMQYGTLMIEKLKVNEALYFGDRNQELREGLGQFNGSHFPGELGTTLIGGHSNRALSNLNVIEPGDEIKIKTNYGEYYYKVSAKKVARYDDPTAAQLQSKTSKLILYTCYPFDLLGWTDERLFVYADYKQGPLIDENA